MATQIVYLDDPKAGSGWNVVQKMDHRNVYAIPELDPTDNNVNNVADQRLESSMENDAETLRDTNVIQEPFQIQGVSSIEIPIQSITIDLGDLPRYDVAVGPSNDDDIDVFGDVYVRPGNELAESLHTTMVERSQLVLQESASQLPPETPIESVDPPHDAGFQILTQTLDQTLGRRPGTYCRGMGNARQREPRPRSSSQANSQVTVLTSRVAELEGQMSVILQSLARSGIPIPNFGASTSEPVQPEHPQHTTAPADAHTSEPHVADDQLDFGTLFD
ncbi:PREDICTED: uncharacterized protein LOC107881315 [Prunus mume]|uniref:Uncharacterized protein LOC107881315 n=1 Tax=Prunus mume TaxID=102107 RepID=A0ABM1LSK0_PRUMU|nr:PREDICTED: uncharacterized protein LOC107881315 [Prunus mume]